MTTLQSLTILIILCIQSFAFSQTNTLENFSEKYDGLIEDNNTGIAILIKKENQIHTTSLGNSILTENSVFNIASATKTFTAILILQELEKGNLKLTDSIGKFLNPIKNVPQSLTIENLLIHESGLDEVAGGNIEAIFYSKNDSIYNSHLLGQVETYDKENFGKFDYCNTNYFLLGRILETITDRSYFDLLNERIIQPLGLKNTYPYVSKSIPNLATPYHNDKDVTSYLDYRFFTIVNAAGSIASTLLDMEVFYTSLFETEILLKKETVEMMLQAGNENYGYGIFKSTYDNQNYYGHGGNNIGYAFRNGYNPRTKNLYLMFSNSKRVPTEKLITNNLLALLHDKEVDKLDAVNMSSFKKYTGTYLLKEANLTLKIIEEENKFYLVVDSQGIKSSLMQKNENTLFDTTVGATLSIIEGDNSSLTFQQNDFITTISKVVSQ